MSNPTKINSGIVTTLAATDLILGVDPGGATLKPITLDNLLAIVRSSIKVGGRNLAINSGTNMVASTGVSNRKLSMPLVVGEKYTVSFDIDYGETKPYFEVYLSEAVGQAFSSRNVIERKDVNSGHNVFIMTITKPASVFALFNNSGLPITISNLKVERGNVATDWTPAPEDLGWGGVNRYFTTVYNSTEKRGAHELANDTHRGNTKAHTQILSRHAGQVHGPERCHRNRSLLSVQSYKWPGIRSLWHTPIYKNELGGTPSPHFLPNRRSVLPRKMGHLEELVSSFHHRSLAIGKEVAA